MELNATHYGMPTAEQILKWGEKAKGRDFTFCPKVSKEISHYGSLKDKELLLAEFIKLVKGFGPQLGSLLFQISDRFATKRQEELEHFLQFFTVPTFFEVRHEDWFHPGVMKPFLENLHRQKKGIVTTDTPGKRNAVVRQLTVPAAFIRFGAEGDHPLDDFRLPQWKKQIESWLAQGMKDCYFFLQLYNQGRAFEFSQKVRATLEPLFH